MLQDPSDGKLILIDWKRSDRLNEKYCSKDYMKPPFQDLYDCAGEHYRTQLNMYRWILEKYCSVCVKACYVVWVYPAYAPDGFVDEVQDLQEMVAVLMTQQRDRLHTSAAAAEPEPTQAFLVRHASALETSQVQLADIHETVKRRRLTEAAQKTAKAFSDLFDATRAAGEDLISRMPAAQPGSGPPTIVQHATSLQNFVRAEQPTWEEAMVRLAAAALSVYRSRLSNMFIGDHVSLLWIMEGEIHLRAHAGICYMYQQNTVPSKHRLALHRKAHLQESKTFCLPWRESFACYQLTQNDPTEALRLPWLLSVCCIILMQS